MTANAAARREKLAGGCAILLGLCLTVCLGGVLFAAAWVKVPLLHGTTDYVYACAGVNLYGRFRIGYAWDSNISGMTSTTISLPENVCGYYPRPPFLPFYGGYIWQF